MFDSLRIHRATRCSAFCRFMVLVTTGEASLLGVRKSSMFEWTNTSHFAKTLVVPVWTRRCPLTQGI